MGCLLVFFSLKNICASNAGSIPADKTLPPEAHDFKKMIFQLWHYKEVQKARILHPRGLRKHVADQCCGANDATYCSQACCEIPVIKSIFLRRGSWVSPGTVSNLNQKVYARIEQWRSRKLEGHYPYVYLDGICLKRSWGGEVKNVSVLVAIGVTADGFREIIGAAEGEKEDKEGWLAFLRHLKKRGLKGVRLIVSDKCLGLVESLGEAYPRADWQRCVVHWYRNIFKNVPRDKMRTVAAMLKAIHAQEDREAAREKAVAVVAKLKAMKLHKASAHVGESVDETLSYMAYPEEHWRRIRTNNPLERIMREIRRRTRVVGSFPDGKSALMLVAARLRHIAGTKWGTKRYLCMERLYELDRMKEAV